MTRARDDGWAPRRRSLHLRVAGVAEPPPPRTKRCAPERGCLSSLERYCPVEWSLVSPGVDVSLGDGLSCRAFDVPTKRPARFGPARELSRVVGYRLTDEHPAGRRCTCLGCRRHRAGVGLHQFHIVAGLMSSNPHAGARQARPCLRRLIPPTSPPSWCRCRAVPCWRRTFGRGSIPHGAARALSPESVVVHNRTGTDILGLCDGGARASRGLRSPVRHGRPACSSGRPVPRRWPGCP
jgi:hypothetical protein